MTWTPASHGIEMGLSSRSLPCLISLGLLLGLLAPQLLVPRIVAAQEVCPAAGNPATEAGWAALRDGRLAEARERFSQALVLCPFHLGARTGSAYVDLREGRDDEARAGLAGVLEADPGSVDALVGLGILAWRRGELEEVGRFFRRVQEVDPGNATAADYLGRLPSGLEQPPERGPDPRPDTLDPERADEAWNQGDTELAARLYGDILAADSSDGRALHRLALIHAWKNEHGEALALFDRLLALEPENLEAGVDRARVLAWRGDLDEAMGVVDRILSMHPDYPPALEAKAQFQSWTGEYTGALSSYDRLVGISGDPTGALLAQARILGWASRLEESRSLYDSILAENPRNLEARRGLAQNLRWQGRNAAALQVLEGASADERSNPDFLEQLRWVHAALGPRMEVTLVREGDSDDNAMTTATMAGGWNPVPRLAVRGEAYTRDLQQTTLDLTRYSRGVNLQASYQLEPGWVFNAMAGGSRSDGTASSSTLLRAGVTSPERYNYGGAVRFSRYPLDATAQLVEQGVRVASGELSGRWSPAPGWQIAGSAGVGTFSGEAENRRLHANARVDRRVKGGLTLGLSHRYFGFEKDLDEFYFDPDYFGLTEATGRWLWEPGRWGLLLEAAPGLQKIRSDGDPSAAFRASARLFFRLAPGREVSLSGGYSSAGLQSFSTGDSDYRYRAFILGGSWVF
jgi:tetratricopeptide (TPR) repeat protein